ncbi:bifunctional diaminohydroxyphosphoribosylaminopyrimidine deaminase/5-amino-6-(5-phosphoribosylamino)uracil reductase RibD [Kitasatospora sp. HPMI-4]|uniref:bifunctional diaminohydroxyphosphoribosylaminopyrimidine deaminase/5-amino-6-(5-phosphoribosylamino)uracil reductase RibD n=1 Tax=Kitasatospora sp. HPMI-4 TaxID=3448443 RepID=UPI003F1C0680
MRRAVELAGSNLGATTPNPTVGCVILDRSGVPVAEGRHEFAGGPHAEAVALRRAGSSAFGGTAVVTLEPCAHVGRTGPCAHALRAAGIRRVVYAVADPTPIASGGADYLRAAGLSVVGGVLETKARRANRFWLHAVAKQRPYLTWKFGGTLDGRAAAVDGTSRWITGVEARRDAHELRAVHDAVLVGSGTVRADDPHLGLRHGVRGTPPARVVLAGSAADLPADARIWDESAPTLLLLTDAASAAHLPERVHRIAVPATAESGADVSRALEELYARGIHSVLVEGGPRIAAALLRAGLVDEIVGYVAPLLLGAGPSVLADAGIATLADGVRLDVLETKPMGQDLRITALPGRAAPSQ